MNNNYAENKTQELKQERLFKAFEGVKYNFFADWTDMDRLTQELLGTDIQTILP